MVKVKQVRSRRQDDFVTLADAAKCLGVAEEAIAIEIFNEERARPLGGMYDGRFYVFVKDLEELKQGIGKCSDLKKLRNRRARYERKMRSGHDRELLFCKCGKCTKKRDIEDEEREKEERAKFAAWQAAAVEKYHAEDKVFISSMFCFEPGTRELDPYKTREFLRGKYPVRLARLIAKRVLTGDQSIKILWC